VQQKQIVVAIHAGTSQCTVCHNPHSPRTFKGVTPSASKGNAAAGKVIAAGCDGCHGEGGTGGDAPALAGQKVDYLVAALKAYRIGTRNDQTMSAMAKDLSDNDIYNVAAHYSAAKCKSAGNGNKKAAAAGLTVAAKCAVCHGEIGISKIPSWPNLAGQSGDYLVSSLKSYKASQRKNSMMDGVVKDLSDADAANVAAYFANAACR
jgi:cytochrome c553